MILNRDHRNTYNLVKQQKTKIKVYFANDSNVIKNSHGDVIGRSTAPPVEFYSFPIEMNPSEKIRKKHGIETPVDIMLYITVYEITLNGLSIADFQPENLVFNAVGQEWKMTKAVPFSHNGGTFLYLILAGKSDLKK